MRAGLLAAVLFALSLEAGACQRDPLARPRPQAANPAKPSPEALKLFGEGLAAEKRNDMRAALTVYKRAAKAGSGAAARRLAEIYERGLGGVQREYSEALKWYKAAEALGEEIPMAGC